MKKFLSILLVVVSASFIGCSSDDSSNGGSEEALFLKFTYNGQQFNLEPATITSLQKLIIGNEEVNNVQTGLSLWMPENPSVGSYTITDETPSDANLSTLHNASLSIGDSMFEASTGTLVITQITDDYISGTFSFSGTDENGVSAAVTNGSFKAYN